MLAEADLIGDVRDLQAEDLDWLKAEGAGRSDADLNVVRERHHRIAQLLALGEKNVAIAGRLGISPQSVGTLARSPAMKALVEQYRSEVFEHDHLVRSQIEEVGLVGLRKIHVGIVTDQIQGSDLIRATMDLFDRAGHGPTKTVKTANLNLSGEDLVALKRAAREAEDRGTPVGGKIIEIAPSAEGSGTQGQGSGLREGDNPGASSPVPRTDREPLD